MVLRIGAWGDVGVYRDGKNMESAVPLRLSFSELITTPSPCLDNEYTQQFFLWGRA